MFREFSIDDRGMWFEEFPNLAEEVELCRRICAWSKSASLCFKGTWIFMRLFASASEVWSAVIALFPFQMLLSLLHALFARS